MRLNNYFIIGALTLGLINLNEAGAITTTGCGNALYEIMNHCYEGTNIPTEEEFFNAYDQIFDECFCGPIQSNSKRNSTSQDCNAGEKSDLDFFSGTNQNAIDHIEINGTCPIFVKGSTSFANTHNFCKISNETPDDREHLAKRMHLFKDNLASYFKIHPFQKIANKCPNYFKYVTNDSILSETPQLSKGIFLANKISGLNASYQKENVILIGFDSINLPKNFEHKGNIITPKELILNGNTTFTGFINTHILTLNALDNKDISIKEGPQKQNTCQECNFADTQNTHYNIILSDNLCSPTRLKIEECKNNGSCTPLSSDVYADVTYTLSNGATQSKHTRVGSNGIYLNNDNVKKISVTMNQDFTCNGAVSGSCVKNIDNNCKVIIQDSYLSYINQLVDFKLTFPENDLNKLNPSTGDTIITVTDVKGRITFKANKDTKIKYFANEGDPTSNIITINKGTTKELIVGGKYYSSSFTPKLAILSPVSGNDLLVTDLKLDVTFSDGGTLTNTDINLTQDLSFNAIPLAFCESINNSTSYENANLITAGDYYSFKQEAIVCPNSGVCDNNTQTLTLNHKDLKNLCENNDLKITLSNDEITHYQNSLNLKENFVSSFDAINPTKYSEWKLGPTSNVANLSCPHSSICTSTISLKDLEENENDALLLGFSKSDNLNRSFKFKDMGWFSFSEITPITLGYNSQMDYNIFFYSPVYTVIPHHLSSIDKKHSILNRSYDYYLNNKILEKIYDIDNELDFNTQALDLRKGINSVSCPGYLSQKLSNLGFIKAVDNDGNVLNNIAPEYISNFNFNEVFFTPSGTSTLNIKKYDFGVGEAKTYHKTTYVQNLGFPYRVNFNFSNDHKVHQEAFMGIKSSFDFLVASNNLDTLNDKKVTIFTKNNLLTEIKKDSRFNWIVTEKDAEESTSGATQTSITYDGITDGNHLETLQVDSYHPISAYKGRIVSEIVIGQDSNLYVPITMQYFDDKNKSWKVASNDSCSFLTLYSDAKTLADTPSISFTNGDSQKVTAQSNGNLTLTTKYANTHTIVSLRNNSPTNESVKSTTATGDKEANFKKGVLLLEAIKPQVIKDESQATFTFMYPTDADNQSKLKPINYLPHLIDDNTSRGGFIFRTMHSNPRVVDVRYSY